jgi:hypothetical protein
LVGEVVSDGEREERGVVAGDGAALSVEGGDPTGTRGGGTLGEETGGRATCTEGGGEEVGTEGGATVSALW